jgi:hypothetical protein
MFSEGQVEEKPKAWEPQNDRSWNPSLLTSMWKNLFIIIIIIFIIIYSLKNLLGFLLIWVLMIHNSQQHPHLTNGIKLHYQFNIVKLFLYELLLTF